MKIKYEADDGKLFDTMELAKAHEEAIVFKPILGLDEARLMLALQRHPDALDIAEALEKAGTRIASLRRASGELKRERKGSGHTALYGELMTDFERAEVIAILKERGGDEKNGRDVAAAFAEFDARKARLAKDAAGEEAPQAVEDDEPAAGDPPRSYGLLETADREEAARAAAERVEGLPL